MPESADIHLPPNPQRRKHTRHAIHFEAQAALLSPDYQPLALWHIHIRDVSLMGMKLYLAQTVPDGHFLLIRWQPSPQDPFTIRLAQPRHGRLVDPGWYHLGVLFVVPPAGRKIPTWEACLAATAPATASRKAG